MELYATGFNAWRQLEFGQDITTQNESSSTEEPDDVRAFQLVLRDHHIERPHASLANTYVNTASGLRTAGFQDAPDTNGSFLMDKLISSTAAVAGNGLVAVYDEENGGTIRQYPSMAAAKTVYGRPDCQYFTGLGKIVQLVAWETGFAALSENGHVWTWGDGRYSACLGREVDDSSPAQEPCIAGDLNGLPTGQIRRLAAGGYIVVALTEGDDLYVWGGHPARPALFENLSGSPMPVAIHEQDILDCAVGDSHIIGLASDGRVYVIGDNSNGQLGISSPKEDSWSSVPLQLQHGQVVKAVGSGPRCSFIIIEQPAP